MNKLFKAMMLVSFISFNHVYPIFNFILDYIPFHRNYKLSFGMFVSD